MQKLWISGQFNLYCKAVWDDGEKCFIRAPTATLVVWLVENHMTLYSAVCKYLDSDTLFCSAGSVLQTQWIWRETMTLRKYWLSAFIWSCLHPCWVNRVTCSLVIVRMHYPKTGGAWYKCHPRHQPACWSTTQQKMLYDPTTYSLHHTQLMATYSRSNVMLIVLK